MVLLLFLFGWGILFLKKKKNLYICQQSQQVLLHSLGSFTERVFLVHNLSIQSLLAQPAVSSSVASTTAELYCILSLLLQSAEENQQYSHQLKIRMS